MNTLLASPFMGAFWTVFLFSVCFLGIHVIKLARIGWEIKNKKEPPKTPPPEKKKAPPKQEPIYYLVEKKRRKKEE